MDQDYFGPLLQLSLTQTSLKADPESSTDRRTSSAQLWSELPVKECRDLTDRVVAFATHICYRQPCREAHTADLSEVVHRVHDDVVAADTRAGELADR